MIDTVIRGMLGKFGSALLDTYIEYNLLINGIVLFYALIYLLGKRVFKAIHQEVMLEMTRKHGGDLSLKSIGWFRKTMERNPLDWQKIRKITKLPFISLPGSLLIRGKSEKVLQKYFSAEVVAALFKVKDEAEQPKL